MGWIRWNRFGQIRTSLKVLTLISRRPNQPAEVVMSSFTLGTNFDVCTCLVWITTCSHVIYEAVWGFLIFGFLVVRKRDQGNLRPWKDIYINP